MPLFEQLNQGWNAEPNAPEPAIGLSAPDLLLRFVLNPFQVEQFEEEDVGVLRFHDCVRYRLGSTNDEGWYFGQCRYGRSAPAWGEFYELIGEDPLLNVPTDWVAINEAQIKHRHFLFYLKDNTLNASHPIGALTHSRRTLFIEHSERSREVEVVETGKTVVYRACSG
jgi:hypothetical protein